MDCTSEYEFTLILTDVDGVDEQLEDALFEAGCDDATVASRHGCVYVTFARQATSMLDAIVSAINNIRNAKSEAKVLRVDDCSLVTQAEIARRSDRSRQVIQMYISGERGPGRFPPPACRIVDRQPLWHWCEVSLWLVENQMIREKDFMEAHDIDMINTFLEMERQKETHSVRLNEIKSRLSSGRVDDNTETPEFC